MKYLVTGGCGFLGANLAQEVLKRGDELVVFDNLSRIGAENNLSWLREQGLTNFVYGDIRSIHDVQQVVAKEVPDIIFHLAGQVAMTTSINDPRRDFEINMLGTHNLLHTVCEYAPKALVIYSSTNKVYGNLEQFEYRETAMRYEVLGHSHGFDENLGLDFRSPYGCSKGGADQYMLEYARSFGLRTIVFRHSSIFGQRQFSTYDQGWVGWFVRQAILSKRGKLVEPFTISGDGKQVRDVLFAPDLVRCYFNAATVGERCAGHAFNIGGGVENSISLLELFDILNQELGIKLRYTHLPWRPNDQKVFVSDIRKATNFFAWTPKINKQTGLSEMIKWISESEHY